MGSAGIHDWLWDIYFASSTHCMKGGPKGPAPFGAVSPAFDIWLDDFETKPKNFIENVGQINTYEKLP